MAINTTKGGGIYIEIGGDAKPLYQVLEGVKTHSNQIAGGIAKEFNGAMSSVDASRTMNSVTRSFAQLKAGLQGASANVAQFEKSFQDVGKQMGLAQRQAQTFGQTMAAAFKKQHESDVTSALRAIQRQAGLTNVEMEKLARNMGAGAYFKPSGMQSSVASMGKFAVSAAAAYVSVSSVVGAVNALKDSMLEMSRLQTSYKTIFGSEYGASQQLDYIYERTQAVGLQFQNTAASAKGFFASVQGTDVEKSANDMFDAVSKAAGALQLSSSDVDRIYLALGQMVSKGKVSAEEMRQQFGEVLPGAFQLAAKAMGMTTAELDKFMSDGKLLAEDLFPKLAKEMNEKFAKGAENAAKSLQGSLNQMSTEWERFKAGLVDSGPAVFSIQIASSVLKDYNDASETDKKNLAIDRRLAQSGIAPAQGALSRMWSGDLYGYSEAQREMLKIQDNVVAKVNKMVEGRSKAEETRVAKTQAIIKASYQSTTQAKIAELEKENDASKKAFEAEITRLEAIGGKQTEIDELKAQQAAVQKKYQSDVESLLNKGTGGAKGLANKQFKFDTGLEQLRQEVANMEATINPAAVGIDKLRQKLALEKKDAIAAAEAHATLAVRHKEASADEAATRKGLEIRKAELIYAQKLADAEEKGRQVRVDFYKDFAALSGNYVASINAQIEAIRRQAEEYRNAGISEELTQQWEALKRLESARDPLSGTVRGLRQYANDATDMAKGMEQAWTGGFTAMEDAAVKSIMNMKFSFTDMANSIISDLIRISVRSSITGPLASGLGSLFSGMGSWTTSSATSGAVDSAIAWVHHSGGVVGSGSAPTRAVPTAAFSGAPKFHSGGGMFAPDEYPAILQKGEIVIPKSLAQGTGGRSGGYSSSAQPQVTVNIQNNTGAEVSQRTRTDNMGNKSIEVMIGDAVAKQTAKPGTSMNRVVRSATGGRARTVQH